MIDRLRRVDPLGPGLSLVALGVFLAHGFQGILSRDLGLYSYSAQQVVEGVPPYVSVLNRAGPLAHLVPSVGVLGARVLDVDDLLGMRVLMMLLSVACVWVFYLLGRDLFASRLAGLVSASVLLTFQGFVTYATGGPREKTTMLLCLMLAIYAVVRQRWLVAGVFVALATLTWQPVFVIGTAITLVAMTPLGVRAGLRALARFAVGGLITVAVFLIGFALAGALREFVDSFLLINAQYTDQSTLIEFLGIKADTMLRGFGWSLWVILAGLVAMLGVAVAHLRLPGRREPRRIAVIGLGGGVLAGALWSLKAFNGWADLVAMLPLAALGIGGLVAAIRSRRPRAGTGLAVVAAVVALLLATTNSVLTRDDRLRQQQAEVSAMFALVPPDATVVSVGAPQPLVLTHRTNPTRHQMFLAGLSEYVDDTYPGGLAGFAAWLESEEPTFLTMDHPEWYGWLDEVVERDYVRVGENSTWTWYADRSLGDDVIRRLRRVHLATLTQDSAAAALWNDR